MARFRPAPKCPWCDEVIAKAIHSKRPGFIGDTFLRWEIVPHTCKGKEDAAKEISKKIKKIKEDGGDLPFLK